MRSKINILWPFVAILSITILVFWQFFFKGMHPFPGDYLVAWYEPWKTIHTSGQTITIPHKPVADDVFRQLFPFKVLAMDMVKNFQLPLWNPYNGAGMPLLATMHPGFLNPFNVFFLLFEPQLAWSLHIIIQLLLIGVFAFLYSRILGISKNASLFSSVSFMLSGFVIARLIFGEYIYPLSFLPLLLYLVELYKKKKSQVINIATTIITALLFFSGHPHVIFYILLFTVCYVFFRLKPLKNATHFLFLMFLGIGIASVQLIPTIEIYLNANISRESSAFIFDKFLLPPQQLLSILIPNYFGNQATYNYWGAVDYIETVVSIGSIPVFFAFSSFVLKNNDQSVKKFYLVATILTALLTLNWLGARLLASLPIPIISTGVPSRIFMLTTFSLSILAGFGFDAWEKTTKLSKKNFLYFLLFILLIIGIGFATTVYYFLKIPCHNIFVPQCREIAFRNTVLELTVFIIGFSLFISWFIFRKNRLITFIPFTLLTLVVAIGFYNSSKFLPFSKEETILPKTPLLKAIQEKTKDGRIFGFGKANIRTDFATHFRFYDPNFYDPLYNKRYGELIAFANNGKLPKTLPRSDVEIINQATATGALKERREKLFTILGVKYFIYSKDELPIENSEKVVWQDNNWYIIQNNNALPRVRIVQSFQKGSSKQILSQLFSNNIGTSKTVLLEETLKFFGYSNNRINSSIRITKYGENEVDLSVHTNANAILVLSDNYYPGWKAFVDGKETKIYRANYTFRAIEIPQGKHTVLFTYQPNSFYVGVIISTVTLIFLGFYFFIKVNKTIPNYKY